jgi:hypothetical protein
MQKLRSISQVLEERPHKTERQLRRYVAEHRLPFYKIDGRIYFDLDELDQHDAAGRVEAV